MPQAQVSQEKESRLNHEIYQNSKMLFKSSLFLETC